MIDEEQQTSEELNIALDLLNRRSQIGELRRELLTEQTALDQSSNALKHILSGTVEQDILLNQEAARKLQDVLDPKDIPNLSITQEWVNIKDPGNYNNDGAKSGQRLFRVGIQGNESYMLVSFEEDQTVSAEITKNKPQAK